MSESKRKITVVCPQELVDQVRRHQARLYERTGARVSLSAAAASLMRQGLREGGRR